MRKNTILGYVVGILGFIVVMVCLVAACCSCEASYGGSELDVQAASSSADRLQANQPTLPISNIHLNGIISFGVHTGLTG